MGWNKIWQNFFWMRAFFFLSLFYSWLRLNISHIHRVCMFEMDECHGGLSKHERRRSTRWNESHWCLACRIGWKQLVGSFELVDTIFIRDDSWLLSACAAFIDSFHWMLYDLLLLLGWFSEPRSIWFSMMCLAWHGNGVDALTQAHTHTHSSSDKPQPLLQLDSWNGVDIQHLFYLTYFLELVINFATVCQQPRTTITTTCPFRIQ